MSKNKINRSAALLRARIHRFAEKHELSGTEVATLLDVPAPTMHAWLNNNKYPRNNERIPELNAKLDKLDRETRHCEPKPERVDRVVVAKTAQVVMPQQGELELAQPAPPVKPTTTEQELRWIVEGYRNEAIQGLGDELPYVLAQYRKQGALQ